MLQRPATKGKRNMYADMKSPDDEIIQEKGREAASPEKTASHLADGELLRRLSHADSRNYAFNLLVRKYQERVYFLVRKMVVSHEDANDLTQEIFVKVWTNIDKFRADSQLFTWIYRIATNECLGFLRRKRTRFFLPIHDLGAELSQKINPENGFTGDEISQKLEKALLKLPDKQRLVFNMKYFEEMKYEEMSEVLGTSVGALKASYHHAVRKIEADLSTSIL